MPVVGDASVVVRAITNQVRSDIRRALSDARPDVRAEGANAGKDYADSFGSSIGSRIQGSIQGAFSGNGASQAASQAGQQTGRSFTDSLSGALGSLDLTAEGQRLGDELGSAMVDSVGKSAADAGGEAERALGNSGGRGGNAFKQALNSAFADSAVAASRQFTVLIASSNLLGAGIGSLISSISAVVSGLFAMGAAASQAAGGLAVLPGVIGAAIQGMGTLKLAFSGVGKAVTAGFAPATAAVTGTSSAANAAVQAVRSAQNAVAKAINGVADAQRNLGRVVADSASQVADARNAIVVAYRDAAESAATAAQKVADSENKVLDAERNLLDIQKQLNDARATAAEQLQQLGFSAEDAALAEERAGLKLQDAHAALVAASSLPPDDRNRKEAELAFKEADLNYRQAKDRNSDLAKEQDKAAKAGVDGSASVLDAKAKIADAENQVIDAERNLADARQAQAKDARDSAESIAAAQAKLAKVQLQNARSIFDAQQSVADAQQRLAEAQAALAAAQQKAKVATDGSAKSANAYRDALAALSPAAQAFVKYLVSIKDETKRLKAAAGAELFPGLQAGLEPIVNNLFPVLEGQLGRTGGLIGQMGSQFGKTIATGEGLKNVTTVLQEQNDTLAIFTTRGADGSTAVQNLAIVFTRLMVAIQPITQRFATWIAMLLSSAAAATDTQGEMGKLVGFFQRAGDTAAQLGRIFKNLWDIVFGLGKAATTSGNDLLTTFENATKKLADFIALPSTQKDLEKFFAGVGENLKAVGRLVDALGLAFLGLGDNPGIKGFADNMVPAMDNLGKLGDAFTNAGPQMGEFAKQITELMLNMTQSEGVQKFISALTAVLKVVNSIVTSDAGKWFLGIAASVAAITRVAALVMIPLRFLFKALVGGPIAATKGFLGLLGFFTRLKAAFASLKNGEGLKAAFANMSKASKGTEKAFNEQMVVDKKKVSALKTLEKQSLATKKALAGLAGGSNTAKKAFTSQMVVDKKKAASLQAVSAAAGGQATKATKAATTGATAATSTAATGAISPAVGASASKAVAPVGKLGGAFGALGKGLGAVGKGIVGFLGPIGIAMIVIPILISIFKKLYTENVGFRKFIDGLVAKFKEGLDWIVKNVFPVFASVGKFIGEQFVDKVVPILKILWDMVKLYIGLVIGYVKVWIDGIKWAITNVLIPLWNNVLLPLFKILWDIIKLYIGLVIGYVKLWIDGIKWAISNILIPLWNNVLLPIFAALWDVAKRAFDLVVGGWNLLVNAIKWAYDNVIAPVWGAFKTALQALSDAATAVFDWVVKKFTQLKDGIVAVYNKFIVPFWDNFKKGLQTIGDKARDVAAWVVKKFTDLKDGIIAVYNKYIAPIVTTINDAFQRIANKARDIVSDVKGYFQDVGTGIGSIYTSYIQPAIDKIKDGFQGIVTKATDIVNGVKTIFTKLKDAPSEGIKNLVNNINKYLIDNINKMGKVFGFEIPHIPVPQFAEGGLVRGPGGPKDDKILARLSNKEFVVNARETAKNLPMLQAMNAGKLGGFPAIGGWNPFEGIKDGVTGFVGDNLSAALEKLVRPFTEKFASGDSFAEKFFRSVVPKLIETMKTWGDKKSLPPINTTSPVTGNIGSGPFVKPMGSYVISQPWKGQYPAHSGIDLATPVGTPIYAITEAVVRTVKQLTTSYGHYIILAHKGFDTLYAHMSRFVSGMKAGMKVSAGTLLGWSGSTGNSTGPHLHLEVRSPGRGYTYDPRSFLAGKGVRLAKGGLVKATSGGVLSLIGEAGRNERVEPLDRQGLSNRDRAMVALLENLVAQQGNGDTFHVYPTRGMSEVELAESVSRRVAFKKRTGT